MDTGWEHVKGILQNKSWRSNILTLMFFFYCCKSRLLSDQIRKAFHFPLFGSIRHTELGLLKPVISTETGHPLLI